MRAAGSGLPNFRCWTGIAGCEKSIGCPPGVMTRSMGRPPERCAVLPFSGSVWKKVGVELASTTSVLLDAIVVCVCVWACGEEEREAGGSGKASRAKGSGTLRWGN